MSKPSVLISIDTEIETGTKAFGRSFMESMIDKSSNLTPELISTSERFTDSFVDLDQFIEDWWAIPIKTYFDGRPTGERLGGPLWKRKSPLASRGKVSHGLINKKGRRIPSNLWFESRWNDRVDFADLFRDWVAQSKPNIGMLHLFTGAERSILLDEHGSWFQTGSFGGPAKPGIPDIGWAMAYGPSYACEVAVDKITSAGFPVQQFSEVVIVQVTENLADVYKDFSMFNERRAELKRLFRPGLFWINS